MRKTTHRVRYHARALLVMLVVPVISLAQDAPGDRLSFISCPILQDTNTVPCWMTEYNGEKYFLGIQTDSSGWPPPYLKHQVLVEGVVADMPRICGGIVLESSGTPFDRRSSGSANGLPLPNPPVTSNLRELDLSCNTILPINDAFNTLEPRRGPGPNIYRAPPTPEEQAAAIARREAQARANMPVPPYQPRNFDLFYEFDSELAVLTIGNVNDALDYAKAVNASTIRVTGYRSSALLSSGATLQEAAYMARHRAQEAADTFRKLGIPDGVELVVQWQDDLVEGDGNADWQGRRTEIQVIP